MSTPPQVPTGRRIAKVREKAPFVPIDPKLDLDALIAQQPNFETFSRVDARTLDSNPEGLNALEEIIHQHVIVAGLPLVIENWHLRSDWPRWLFDPQWLAENHGHDCISVRDLVRQSDTKMTMGHYLRNLGRLTDKFSSADYDSKQQRLYGKDLDCPPVWQSSLSAVLPKNTFYLAPAADLMSSLPPPARAENMMCYIGHEGTYTPAHKEMCASLGQNIMVHTSSGRSEPGSSIWFMMSSADREVIAEYWLSQLGHDIEVESHFASIDDLRDAPFTVYIHEQKLGDYILVPPLAPHQVWNRGETTIKAAWNRTIVDTLELAVSEALPKARLVCRDEQYKNRAIIHETLKKYAKIFHGDDYVEDIPLDKLQRDFVKLFKLFDSILLNECFSPELPTPEVEKIENEYNVQCSFCRGNIWNRFLSCKWCVEPAEDGEDEDCYDVCMDCYARGRSCGCVSKLHWVEQHDWRDLENDHEEFREIILGFQTIMTEQTAKSIGQSLKELGRKTLARVCQEQLKVRPWVDVTKNGLESEEDETMDLAAKKKAGLLLNCHVCKIRHPKWKCAECSTCNKVYCYGNLWRAFDMDPFDDILSKFKWQCPVCLGICSCGACRKRSDMHPYEPKGTFIGASTKHVADPRSVETLVDFARGNLGWIKDVDTEHNILKRKRESLATDAGGNRAFGVGSPSDSFKGPDGYSNAEMHEVPIDPALGFGDENTESYEDLLHGTSHHRPSWTATNGSSAAQNGVSSADMEGRSQPAASISGGEDNGSNTYGSLQALSTAALQTTNLQKMEQPGVEEVGEDEGKEAAGEAAVGQSGFNPPFPSPSAMLTGALPIGRQDNPLLSSHNSTPANIPYNYGSSNYLNSSLADRSGNYTPISDSHLHQQNFGSSSFPNITSLESNPHAFIAAAGLSNAPNATTDAPSYGPQAQSQASPSTPWNPVSEASFVQPRPEKSPLIEELRPKKKHPPIPLKDRVKSDIKFSTPPIMSGKGLAVGNWVKKTKTLRQKTRNLERKKKLLVKLKMPLARYRAWNSEQLEVDIVTSDLPNVVPIPYILPDNLPIVAENSRSNSAAPKKSGRSSKGWAYLSESESELEEDEDEEVKMLKEGLNKRRGRRESAWAIRKRQEEQAYQEYLDSQEKTEATSTVGGRMPAERKRRSRLAVGKKEVLGVLNLRESTSPSFTPVNPAINDNYIDHPPPPPPEETEEKKLEREKVEAEEAARQEEAVKMEEIRLEKLEREKAARIEELKDEHAAREQKLKRERQARQAAAIAEAAIRRAEAKKKREEEREQKRKEADRKAKLVAAGLLDDDEFSSYHTSDESDLENEDLGTEEEAEAEVGPELDLDLELKLKALNEKFLWEALKIPEEWPLAVVVDVPTRMSVWKEEYVVFRVDDEVSPPLPSPDPVAIDHDFSTPVSHPQDQKRKRGRPRKNERPTSHSASVSKADRPVKREKLSSGSRRKSLADLGDDDTPYRSWVRSRRDRKQTPRKTLDRPAKEEASQRRRTSRSLTTIRYAESEDGFERQFDESEQLLVPAMEKPKKRRKRKIPLGNGKFATVEIEEDDDDEDEVRTSPPPKSPSPPIVSGDNSGGGDGMELDYEWEFERSWARRRR